MYGPFDSYEPNYHRGGRYFFRLPTPGSSDSDLSREHSAVENEWDIFIKSPYRTAKATTLSPSVLGWPCAVDGTLKSKN